MGGMKTRTLVVALLLLAMMQSPVAAAENTPERQSKNARKILVFLGSIGINDPDVKKFISRADSHIKNGYLTLSEERMAGGTLTLHYQLSNGIGVKNVELKFAPDNSNWQATARKDQVMVRYQYKF